VNASSRDRQNDKATTVQCVECDASSGLYWHGWRAYRIDEPGTDESPALAFYCPTCASLQFGRSSSLRERDRDDSPAE
jgi:hypothetical protein